MYTHILTIHNVNREEDGNCDEDGNREEDDCDNDNNNADDEDDDEKSDNDDDDKDNTANFTLNFSSFYLTIIAYIWQWPPSAAPC